ncbi:MAG: hypothetical protein QMD71_08080 [bacterium]|nr:hypothetical protein [bacterium]
MARYYRSPLGIIRGKLGPFLFTSHKGKAVVKMLPPKEKLRRDDIPHINERFIFSSLGYLFKVLNPIIYPYWKDYATHKRPFSEYGLFMKYNLPPLYTSIPDKQKLLSPDNYPNISHISLTYGGYLQDRSQITSISYEAGVININWSPIICGNGRPDDVAHIIVLYWESERISKKFAVEKQWKKIRFWYLKAKRCDGCISMEVERGLSPNYITAFIFFTNDRSYSQSISATI